MGYRSELKLIALGDTAIKFLMLLDGESRKTLEEGAEFTLTDTELYIHIRDWKWYDGYTVVDDVNHTIWEITRDNPDAEIGMIRVGEETTDVEEYGNVGLVNLYTETSISRY